MLTNNSAKIYSGIPQGSDSLTFPGDRQCVIKYFCKTLSPAQHGHLYGMELLNDSLVFITMRETRLHIISISAGRQAGKSYFLME